MNDVALICYRLIIPYPDTEGLSVAALASILAQLGSRFFWPARHHGHQGRSTFTHRTSRYAKRSPIYLNAAGFSQHQSRRTMADGNGTRMDPAGATEAWSTVTSKQYGMAFPLGTLSACSVMRLRGKLNVNMAEDVQSFAKLASPSMGKKNISCAIYCGTVQGYFASI